jgi:hypothetical protein
LCVLALGCGGGGRGRGGRARAGSGDGGLRRRARCRRCGRGMIHGHARHGIGSLRLGLRHRVESSILHGHRVVHLVHLGSSKLVDIAKPVWYKLAIIAMVI